MTERDYTVREALDILRKSLVRFGMDQVNVTVDSHGLSSEKSGALVQDLLADGFGENITKAGQAHEYSFQPGHFSWVSVEQSVVERETSENNWLNVKAAAEIKNVTPGASPVPVKNQDPSSSFPPEWPQEPPVGTRQTGARQVPAASNGYGNHRHSDKNHIAYGQWTSLAYAIEVATITHSLILKGKNAA